MVSKQRPISADYDLLHSNGSDVKPYSLNRSIVVGELPRELRGEFYLTGPGIFQYRDGTNVHPFDGHGLVRRVKFDGKGGASASARFVKTAAYQREAAEGFARLVPP